MVRKRKKSDSKPTPLRARRSEAEIEALLDQIDRELLTGKGTRLDALTDRLLTGSGQVPEMLVRRIVQGRAQVPVFAFELLGILAGRKASTYLKRISEDEIAPDIVRFGARRRLGWSEKGEAKRRLAFLETLKDGHGTLVQAIDQATGMWPPDAEILEEVLPYLQALPAEPRRGIMERAVAEFGIRAALLLQAALHIDDPASQRQALGELVKLRASGAVGAIGRLQKTARDPAVRNEAAAALQRLRIRAVDREPAQSQPLPPVQRVLMSEVDGDGGQVILVVRRWGEGAYMLADIFHNDHWGIKAAFGATRAVDDQVEGIVTGLQEEGVSLVEANLAAARGALSEAAKVNASSGQPIPPALELWELLLHDVYPPPEDEPAVVPELDDSPYAGREDLLRSSAQLADHDFFAHWAFDQMRTLEAIAKAPPPSRGRLSDRQYRPLIQSLMDPQTCAQLRHRLRCQAWLLERSGDMEARNLALAIAADLATSNSAALAKQPFLRTLVEISLERVLADMADVIGDE